MGYLPLSERGQVHRCPHCHRVNWGRAPGLRDTAYWLTKRGKPATTRQIATGLKITLDLCGHRMSALTKLGLVHQTYVNHRDGKAIDRNARRGGQGGRLRVFRSAITMMEFE